MLHLHLQFTLQALSDAYSRQTKQPKVRVEALAYLEGKQKSTKMQQIYTPKLPMPFEYKSKVHLPASLNSFDPPPSFFPPAATLLRLSPKRNFSV